MAEATNPPSKANDTPSSDPKPNGHPATPQPNGTTPSQPQKRPPRPKKPNYAHIHRHPLPLQIHPLPAFHPTNPLSLLRLVYSYISTLFYPPSSHPTYLYTGVFDPTSRSVHVTDPVHIRALWEMGFFGKGTLSRSEPTWLEREKARRELLSGKGGGGGTAEEATRKRREERRAFKLERARVEAEKVRRQRDVEEGKIGMEEVEGSAEVVVEEIAEPLWDGEDVALLAEVNAIEQGRVPDAEIVAAGSAKPEILPSDDKGTDITASDLVHPTSTEPIEPQEYLQLNMEEAFFLSYGLGVLAILPPNPIQPLQPGELLSLFTQHASFPPAQKASSSSLNPANPFLLSYAVYHHFRSLGWVVRPGTKFGCDWLLYNRGPVFSHAEFAIVIIPSYSHDYWNSEKGKQERERDCGGREEKGWWWLHCVTRVQSQVKKSAVLVYVEVPPPVGWDGGDGEGEMSAGECLGRYRVREFVLRRWLMNRSRG